MTEILARDQCRCCGSFNTRTFYEVRHVPVNSVLLLSSREQALRLPTGTIELRFCSQCGFIFNGLFDRKLVEYSSRCEETQGYSDTFRAWHEALARHLIQRHGLRDKEIVEIGCGKGEFLTLLCALGGNHGVGFDPAYVSERSLAAHAGNVNFVAENYSPEYLTDKPDFVCCKMTLEHIPNASEFIRHLRGSLEQAPGATVFFQVPNGRKILNDAAFWDVYYEHCSYYTEGSLVRLFTRHGFDVLNVSLEYGEQYITIEARPGRGKADAAIERDDVTTLEREIARFSKRLPAWIAGWRERLRQYSENNRRVVIWGSGSKGVAFLTAIDIDGSIEYVVDINPYRQGHYMAGTAQEIVRPSFLAQYHPHVVLVMNAIYREEIAAEMYRHGVEAEVVTT